MKKFLVFLFIYLSFSLSAETPGFYEVLSVLKKSYPDIQFTVFYDRPHEDYSLIIKNSDGQLTKLYWCDGSFLPEEELKNKDKYWTLLYKYDSDLKDPAEMTDEEKETLKEFTSRENRKNGKGTPMFFYDAIYHSETRQSVEQNIIRTTFLGNKTTIHKRIYDPLKNVEAKIYEAAKKDEEVKKFVEGIKSSDAYFWRVIDGTKRKSFHSLGIAIDILPKRITGEIFWSWAKDKNPSGWMLTPLSRRWMPPKKVTEIFEEEGFIWGGNWAIWDNMHYEYHPELLNARKLL